MIMFLVGIFSLIFMNITTNGGEIDETVDKQYKDHSVSFGHVLGLFALLSVGFILGTAGISAAERRLRSRRAGPAPVAGGEAAAVLRSQDVARSQAGAGAARPRAPPTRVGVATSGRPPH